MFEITQEILEEVDPLLDAGDTESVGGCSWCWMPRPCEHRSSTFRGGGARPSPKLWRRLTSVKRQSVGNTQGPASSRRWPLVAAKTNRMIGINYMSDVRQVPPVKLDLG